MPPHFLTSATVPPYPTTMLPPSPFPLIPGTGAWCLPPHCCSPLPLAPVPHPPPLLQVEGLVNIHTSPSCPCQPHCPSAYPADTAPHQWRSSQSASPHAISFVTLPPCSPSSPKPCYCTSSGDSSSVKSACPVCLSHHPHHVHKCNNPKIWDRSPAYSRCSTEGWLINVTILFPFHSLFLIVHFFCLTTWRGNQYFINTSYLFISSSPFFSLLALPL